MASENALQRVSVNVADLLRDRMQRQDVSFSFVPPQITPANGGPRLNLYLFQVRENPALRNEEDPRRATSGQFGSPPLALELGYLLTSYGQPTAIDTPAGFPPIQPDSLSDLDGQWILADAMRVLHDNPIVARRSQRQRPPLGPLLDPELQFEFESLRIVARSLNLDELTKLWTAFKEDFHRSVAYDVTAIRVERLKPPNAHAPVLMRGINAQASSVLGAVLNDLQPNAVAAGETVTIVGDGLGDPTLQVVISDAVDTGFPALPQAIPVVRTAQGVQFSVPNNPVLYLPGPKLIALRTTTFPGHTVDTNALVLSLLPGAGVPPNPSALTLSQNTGPFNGTVNLTINGALLGMQPLPNAPLSPLVPSVLMGSYTIPLGDLNLAGLPNSIVATLSAPDPADPNAPVAGQILPVRVRLNAVESRSWRTNPVTQQLEMDPQILFHVT